MEIRELLQKRASLWDEAKKFLDTHTDKDGTISARDLATLQEMEADIDALSQTIEHYERNGRLGAEMDKPFTMPIKEQLHNPFENTIKSRRGVSGDAYRTEFLSQIRTGFKTAQNYLQIAAPPSQGGYLIPTEFDAVLQSELENENVMRQIGRVIQTRSEHKICLVATKPQASWVAEGQSINLDTETFAQISLSAFKLAVGISISNELLQDSFYDLEAHLSTEFGKSLARAEEQAFLTGTGFGQPTGILYTISTDSNCYISTAASSAISVDDLINLQYSVPRPYRKKACWLMSDETVAKIRKLKDSTQNLIWQASLTDSEPPKLLGAPVYTSPFMPTASSHNIPVLFGDFNAFVIGERGQKIFKPLRELHALSDITTFLMIERVDSILTDHKAVKGLFVS
jgi:HK97 family phage major capsid protein